MACQRKQSEIFDLLGFSCVKRQNLTLLKSGLSGLQWEGSGKVGWWVKDIRQGETCIEARPISSQEQDMQIKVLNGKVSLREVLFSQH